MPQACQGNTTYEEVLANYPHLATGLTAQQARCLIAEPLHCITRSLRIRDLLRPSKFALSSRRAPPNVSHHWSQKNRQCRCGVAQVPFEVYLPCASWLFSILNVVADIAFAFDIALNFLTGVLLPRASAPTYAPRVIARAYVADTFVFDVIATVPWEIVRRALVGPLPVVSKHASR